ncbi:MAG: response regulator [Anaerolineae bacterium]
MSVHILLADDHPVLRRGLRALIDAEPGLKVVGEAADADGALRLVEELAPDIVVLDIRMPGMSGIEATRQMIELQPGIRVLILTATEEPSFLDAAMQAGAMGYVGKRVAESELEQAIRAVANGDLYIHCSTAPSLLPAPLPPAVDAVLVEALTPRETEVLRLIALGYTNPGMADKLHISVRTVESHRANLMAKLDLHSRADLVRYAHVQGLLELGAT